MRYHLDRCLFCSQCVESCRRECLSLSNDRWELAARTTKPFSLMYGKETDVEAAETTPPRPKAEQSEQD